MTNQHRLITIPLSHAENMHGYVMCQDKIFADRALNKMMDLIKQGGMEPRMPLVLLTQLEKDVSVKMIREILSSESDAAVGALKEATNFHFSCFTLPEHTRTISA